MWQIIVKNVPELALRRTPYEWLFNAVMEKPVIRLTDFGNRRFEASSKLGEE